MTHPIVEGPTLSSSIPRIGASEHFFDDPLTVLLDEYNKGHQLLVAREKGPMFSRFPKCAGCVAALGPTHTRQVLSDLETFGMPVTVAKKFSLPPKLLKLNSGLFGMTGDMHRSRQKILSPILNLKNTPFMAHAVRKGCEGFFEDWESGLTIPLMKEMRRLALHISGRLFFGLSDQALVAGSAIQDYFLLRREMSGASRDSAARIRPHLIKRGRALDHILRSHIQYLSQDPEPASCLLRSLMAACDGDIPLSQDEVVAHANVLFMSATEPIAASLTWSLLILSQIPELTASLRKLPDTELDPYEHIVKEILRLFPVNALMARLTSKETELGDYQLPKDTEIILSPFISHRDPSVFKNPSQFDPKRWEKARLSPFEYFPFGAGGRYCLGRNLATQIVVLALKTLIDTYHFSLTGDPSIRWKMSVSFIPLDDPSVTITHTSGPAPAQSAKLIGPVADFVDL